MAVAGICVSPAGEIWLSDTTNHRIGRLDAEWSRVPDESLAGALVERVHAVHEITQAGPRVTLEFGLDDGTALAVWDAEGPVEFDVAQAWHTIALWAGSPA